MISRDLRLVEDYETMSTRAAEIVADRLLREPSSVLLLPTGNTPLGMYRRLVELHETGLSFSRATFFNLDEYVGLSPDHLSSYRAYMRRELYDNVDADPQRIHLPDGNAEDPDVEAVRYEAEIRAAGGADLCVLGIGRNGHIGFNEPGTPFDSRTRPVYLDESTRRANAGHFDGEPVPERAITVGLGTILEAREVLLLVSGESKAAALAAALEGDITRDVPASALREHPRLTLLADRAAAGRLSA